MIQSKISIFWTRCFFAYHKQVATTHGESTVVIFILSIRSLRLNGPWRQRRQQDKKQTKIDTAERYFCCYHPTTDTKIHSLTETCTHCKTLLRSPIRICLSIGKIWHRPLLRTIHNKLWHYVYNRLSDQGDIYQNNSSSPRVSCA